MAVKPTLFISAVSRELKSARQLVANTLQFLGYEPVWQDIFGTEQGDLRAMLRDKIDQSQGVVQIIGQRYGAEPPSPDPQFGRVSYTQYEALYAKQQGKKVWYLVVGSDFPADTADPEPPELRAMQQSYRDGLRGHSLYHTIHTTEAMEASVLKLRNELNALRRGVRRWAIGVTAALVLIVVGVVWLVTHQFKPKDLQNVRLSVAPSDDIKEAYHQLTAKLGVRVTDLKESDFHVTIEPFELASMVRIDLGIDPKYGPLMNYFKKSVRINGGTQQVLYAPNMPIQCSVAADQIKTVEIELESMYEATHELEKVGPLTVTPTVNPPSASGTSRRRQMDPSARAQESQKKSALTTGSSLYEYNQGFLAWGGINGHSTAIARLRFGEDPDHLDRVIEAPAQRTDTDADTIASIQNQKNYDLWYIPFREGSNIYSQVELRDGTRGKVVKAPAKNREPRNGVELAPAAGQDPYFRLFAAWATGDTNADFTPVVPDGTVKVFYTFDNGGFFPAKRMEGRNHETNSAWMVGYRFQGPLADARVQVKYELENGKTVGPMSFDLKNAKQILAAVYKAEFVAGEDSALAALKLDFAYPPATQPAPGQTFDDFQQEQEKARFGRSKVNSLGLPDSVKAPCVFVAPQSFHMRSADNRLGQEPLRRTAWTAVREVKIGTKAGQLDRTVPVSPTSDAKELRRGFDSSNWSLVLPADVDQVYAQFVFVDGSTSPEIRLPMVTIKGSE
jgi:hypothetical protein